MASNKNDALDEEKIIICDGCYCCWDGCIFEECFGCSSVTQCLCVEEQCCCKTGTDSFGCGPDCSDDDYCCLCKCPCCTYGWKKGTDGCVCCKQQSQFCCLVDNCSCPPTEEVPAVCACCCITYYVGGRSGDCGCCKKLGEYEKAPAAHKME